jgi:hypothetical protein
MARHARWFFIPGCSGAKLIFQGWTQILKSQHSVHLAYEITTDKKTFQNSIPLLRAIITSRSS